MQLGGDPCDNPCSHHPASVLGIAWVFGWDDFAAAGWMKGECSRVLGSLEPQGLPGAPLTAPPEVPLPTANLLEPSMKKHHPLENTCS